jgi:hypothetical protein
LANIIKTIIRKNMITPSTIAKKVSAQPLPPSEYNFPEQVREGEGKTPLQAGWYTYGSVQE